MITINGLLCLEMRLLMTWTGTWTADVTMKDLTVPSGKVTIVDDVMLQTFNGTVDPARTGEFGEKQHVRVIGGGGGWGKPVRAQHFHSDVGVTLQVLAGATAAEAGEAVAVLAPVTLGVDFVRRGTPGVDPGTAAQIFADVGVDWWVNPLGITQVGVRVPSPAPLSLQVNDWHPGEGTVSFVSSDLVQPGMVIVDTRFGKKFVVEVDATIRDGAIHGTLRLADNPPKPGGTSSELLDSLASLASHATAADYSRVYEYRVIAMAGDRVTVQAVNPTQGMPDLLPISIWGGISGYKATLTPSSRVLVAFTAAKQPYVAAYEPPEGGGWRPVELDLDAVALVNMGAQALAVILGSPIGALPIARAPGVIAFGAASGAANAASVGAIAAAVTAAAAAATATGATPVLGVSLGAFLTTIATAITAAQTTLVAANVAASAALVTSCPSLKVVSS